MKKALGLLLLLLPFQVGCTQMLDRFNADGAEADMQQLLGKHGVKITQIHCDMVPEGSRSFTCQFSVKQYPNRLKPMGTLTTTMKLKTYSTKNFILPTDKDKLDKKDFIYQCYPYYSTLAEFDGQVLGTTMPRQPEINQFEYLFIYFAPSGNSCLTSSYSFG